jgi:hypothetical protein
MVFLLTNAMPIYALLGPNPPGTAIIIENRLLQYT